MLGLKLIHISEKDHWCLISILLEYCKQAKSILYVPMPNDTTWMIFCYSRDNDVLCIYKVQQKLENECQ